MSVSDPDDRNRMMKWMGIAMVVCCTAPITIASLFGGGLGIVFGHETQPISTNKPTNPKANSGSNPSDLSANALSSAVKWQTGNHTHGLSVNPTNPNVIYLATHHGLIQCTGMGKWLWM